MIEKDTARKIIFQKRKELNLEDLKNLNQEFYNNFLSNNFLKNIKSKNIAGYFPINQECNILKILEYYKNNNNILLPVILNKNEKLIFKKWDCNLNSLVKNNLFKKTKILEPNINSTIIEPDIIFIPAVAIDKYGNRIGYGGGYYDRTLKNSKAIKIATIFEFQLFNEILENNKNDIKLDYILTEKNFIKTNNNS